MKSYGNPPGHLGHIDLVVPEVMYYLYYPISLPGMIDYIMEDRLKPFRELIKRVREDEPWRFKEEYVYLTVKKMFVGAGVTPNRPGWHADGFGSDDLNYVWYDCVPTIFNVSNFRITDDHLKSLEQFEQQALPKNDVTYPNCCLLKLDSTVVHRVGDADKQVMRTFVKISISKRRFNLSDNSINYGLVYDWPVFDRQEIRNDPSRAQSDSADSPDDHFA